MQAVVKNVRVSPRKVRLLAKGLVGKKASEVAAQLKFVNRSARPALLTGLESAIANAVNGAKVTAESLVIKNIIVDEGRKLKRAAKGRNARTDRGIVHKKTSHIKIVLAEYGTKD